MKPSIEDETCVINEQNKRFVLYGLQIHQSFQTSEFATTYRNLLK